MLKLYNKEHVAVAALTNLKDYKIEYVLSGEDLLEFSLSIADENIHLIEEEGYVRNKNNEYIIKAIDPTQSLKRYSCVVNIEDIKGKSIANFDTSNNTITETIRLAIAGTGWILAENNITKRRTVRLKNTNALEVLREIRKVFRVDFRFDAINKTIHVYEEFGEDKGVYFSDELNLKSFSIPSDTYDYATRMYCYGKDGLTISSINNGKEYIDNFQYTNKIIEVIWEDSRYTDANSLKEDAEAKLDELSKPKRSYKADIVDLAKQSEEYKFLDFFLGDTITLLSKQEKFRDKQRIVKYIEYPNEPYKNTCELGNTTLTFEELQKENEYKNQVVDNITSDNGTLDGSKVDSIKTEQISDFKAGVAEITDLTAINIKVSNLEAQNVTITGKLNAIEGEFGTLKANVATIDKLTVTHTAQINALEANKASITQLEAVSATIGTLEATVGKIETLVNGNLSSENIQAGGITSDKLTIANGFITNAMIANLDVSKVNAGDISTNKFRIVSDSGKMLIADNTIQIKDNNRVRVQIGKDASNDYNMYVWDSTGKLMFDATGLKADGIKNKIIRDDMISDNANIGGSKINISSLINEVNKDTNTSTIKSSKVNIDLLNQTLDIAFNSLKTQADGTKSLTESHSTIISTMQGEIKTAISNTQITKDGQTVLLKDDYNRTVATVDSMKSTIGSHTTQINEATGKITGVETRVNTVERSLDSITARVSSTETNISTVSDKVNNIKISGRNLFRYSDFSKENTLDKWYKYPIAFHTLKIGTYNFGKDLVSDSHIKGKKFLQSRIDIDKAIASGSTYGGFNIVTDERTVTLEANTEYTFSVWIYKGGSCKSCHATIWEDKTEGSKSVGITESVTKYTGSFVKISVTFRTSNETKYYIRFYHYPDMTKAGALSDVNIYEPILVKGNQVVDWTEAPEDVQSQIDANKTEITTTKNKVSSIETNLASITSRVSTVEQTQNTVNGKVTALETWKKQAEVKITDASIINTVSSQFYKKGETDGKYATQTSLSQLTQTVDNFKFSFQNNGYSNLIFNGRMQNGSKYYTTYGNCKLLVNSANVLEISATTSSSSGSIGVQSSTFYVTAGQKYSISFQASSYWNVPVLNYNYLMKDDGNTRININFDINSSNLKYVTGTFTSNVTGYVKLMLGYTGNIVANNTGFKLTELCVLQGDTPRRYVTNENEISSSTTNVDIDGITVKFSDGSYAAMQYSGFSWFVQGMEKPYHCLAETGWVNVSTGVWNSGADSYDLKITLPSYYRGKSFSVSTMVQGWYVQSDSPLNHLVVSIPYEHINYTNGTFIIRVKALTRAGEWQTNINISWLAIA